MTQLPTDPQPSPPEQTEPGLDAAQQSLSDALRVSFSVLKFVMYVLIVVYLGSGVFRVDEQNTAVRYRFGERIATYGPGWYFGLPFPIDEVVLVPRNQQKLLLDKSFWYNNPDNKPPEELAFQQLDPLNDSFLITGDRNVIHVQFEVFYVIDESNVDDYLKNVGTIERAEQLVTTAAERGMIHAIASSKTDKIVTSSAYPIEEIEAKTQQVLNSLETGITVQQVRIDLTKQSMPNQVREAYTSVTQAQAQKENAIQEALRVYDEKLGKTAGLAHEQLYLLVRGYETALGLEDESLAAALRAEMNTSIAQLFLPHKPLIDSVRAYQDAATASAGSTDKALLESLSKAKADLAKALAENAKDRKTGPPIVGEIASTIREAESTRTQIATQAKTDYENYARDLEAYRKSKLVFANDRLQAVRELVFSGPIQTTFGPVTRINTSPDLEGTEELSEIERQKRLERARREAEAENNR